MRVRVVSLFPAMFEAFARYGIVGRAIERGAVDFAVIDPREFARDRHRSVDDRPYGGGPGMVMRAGPLAEAITKAREAAGGAKVLYLTPQGRRLDQAAAQALAASPALVLLAGRYEGIDERVVELYVDEEWSIGDYVLSGGELPAMVLMDAVIRQLPGVIGHEEAVAQDSFAAGLLDWPHYTRPEEYAGRAVPPVLVSGDHAAIRRWRMKQALGRTWLRRPDLIASLRLTPEQEQLLEEFRRELKSGVEL